jgi:hypothetical protein
MGWRPVPSGPPAEYAATGQREDEDRPAYLTCTLQQFNEEMRRIYGDWDEFMEYVDTKATGHDEALRLEVVSSH